MASSSSTQQTGLYPVASSPIVSRSTFKSSFIFFFLPFVLFFFALAMAMTRREIAYSSFCVTVISPPWVSCREIEREAPKKRPGPLESVHRSVSNEVSGPAHIHTVCRCVLSAPFFLARQSRLERNISFFFFFLESTKMCA